jgi:hypothetical protein
MNLFRKALLPLAGAAVIVLVFSISGPQAVHAVVATLVQVQNTPTTAVPTVAAPAASQLYISTCTGNYDGQAYARCSFDPVPAGQTLFIETESIWSDTGPSQPWTAYIAPYIATSGVGNPVYVPMVQQATDGGDQNFSGTLAARLWAKPGATPSCFVGVNQNGGGTIQCTISGYLAPAQ